jgi:hypothetical protein
MKKFITPKDYPYGLSCEYHVWQAVKASSIIALGRDEAFHDDTRELLRATLYLKFNGGVTIKWDYKSKQERDEVHDLILKDLQES